MPGLVVLYAAPGSGGGSAPSKPSRIGIIGVDDRCRVAIELIGGDDRKVRTGGDDEGGDHQGFRKAESVPAGGPDVGDHDRGSCEAGGFIPARQAPEGSGERRTEELTSELRSLMRTSSAVFFLQTE